MEEHACRKAVERAANILSMRPYSCAGLRRRLEEKGVDPDAAAYAVHYLTELRLLDDESYARELCRSGKNKGWGVMRIRQEMRRKGVGEETAEQVLADFSPDEEKLRRFILSRLGGQKPDRAALRRISDGLYRRGFSWDEINEAISACLEEIGDE